MTTIQKFITLSAGLSALYLVLANPKGVAQLAGSAKTLVGGTFTTIATGGKK